MNALSLRWRLPLLISAVFVLVVATFLGVAYREVSKNLLQLAATRSQATADQLASLFAQSSQQRIAEFQKAAAHPSILQLIANPTAESRAAAQAHLATVVSPNPQLIEVWSAAGERLVAVPAPPSAVDVLPAGTMPAAAGASAFQRYRDILFGETVVEVVSHSPAGNRAAGVERPGFLVVRRTLFTSVTADALNRLVGQGAAIAVGNREGGIWTDLAKAIDPPPVNRARMGVASYEAGGERHLGALAEIRGTPWLLWVGFPHSVVLAPADAFLRRMLLMAFAFVVLSAILIHVVTGRITRPLHELTRASEAIAAGDYSRRAAVHRRDEIGRLGIAFNAMSAQVENAHHQLEARVEQRVREVKEAREELDRFFSLSLDLLCIADGEGRFRRINPAWREMLGWTTEDLTSAPYVDFVHPEDRRATAAETAKLAAGGVTLHFENRYRHKDGSYRWLSWKAAAHPERGVIYAAARDVTQQKEAARLLEHNLAELAAVNRELEAFSYSVSHDLRAPLRHITGFAELLRQSAAASLDADARRQLNTISEAATRMGRLIDDLLSFSRVGRTQLTRSRIDLNQLVRAAQAEVTADVNGREVQWQLHELPTVEGDPAMLRLVLVNLLSNALKYSSTRARAEIEVGVAPGHAFETVFFVRDNGVGFDMQYVDKLFGVFQRLHRTDEFEGTGIGLANVRRIVQRHGGRTWADGRVDGGATFFFSLPQERTELQ